MRVRNDCRISGQESRSFGISPIRAEILRFSGTDDPGNQTCIVAGTSRRRRDGKFEHLPLMWIREQVEDRSAGERDGPTSDPTTNTR